ncbi:MAG TPA: general secretion pathway protein GspB [Ramlibacter sp.]|nr:general secretion pathway protein GspB [Ramlibacter sp.]
MSYILDALRKADAERERDPSRGIHAQVATLPLEAASRGAPWGWLAFGAAAVAAGGAYLAWPTAPVPRPVPVLPAPGFVLEAPRQPVVVPIAAAVVPAAPAPVVATAPAAERAQVKAAPAAVPKAPVPDAAPAVPAMAEPSVPAAVPAQERIVAVGELPADVQRELPKLTISGGVHSENAAQRMLVVGGQVKGEGAELAPGVVLEQIRARSAVLRFKGFRYSIPY